MPDVHAPMERPVMSNPPRILFRADSGVGIGHGHATRIEALARAVMRSGGDARIVARRLEGHRSPAPDLSPVLWLEEMPTTDDSDSAVQADAYATLSAAHAAGFPFNLVVVDHYGLGPKWEQTVRSTGSKVVALDDFPGRPHAANQVVELLPRAVSTPGRLAGIEYLPMDSAYDLPPITVPTIGLRVVVTFGASDPTGHIVVALDALDRLDDLAPSLVSHAIIVAGVANPAFDTVTGRLAGEPRRTLYRQVPSLVPLIRDAHLVLTAAGNAMTEAVAAGRRTIAVVTAGNQSALAKSLAAASLVHLLPSADAATVENLAQALQHVAGPGGQEIEVALARRSIDAFGADRLLEAVMPYARLMAT